MIPSGTVLFAAPNDDLAYEEAMAYLAHYKLDREQVRMFTTSGGMLCVTARKDVVLETEN